MLLLKLKKDKKGL